MEIYTHTRSADKKYTHTYLHTYKDKNVLRKAKKLINIYTHTQIPNTYTTDIRTYTYKVRHYPYTHKSTYISTQKHTYTETNIQIYTYNHIKTYTHTH